jgi:hypothetical protein
MNENLGNDKMAELKMNKSLLIEIQCFGNYIFWYELIKHKSLYWEANEQFQKAGFRNRYQVLGAQGVITLSIPVIGGRANKTATREVKIDNSKNWQRDHWRTLVSCYNKSPFFYHYCDNLEPLYQKSYEWLWDFNLEAYEKMCAFLKFKPYTSATQSYEKLAADNFTDVRGKLTTGARLEVVQQPYFQTFGNSFQKNLCILDSLFNLGNQTAVYLSKECSVLSKQ